MRKTILREARVLLALSRRRECEFLRNLDLAEQPRKILLLPSAPLSLGGGADGQLIDSLIHNHSADLCVVAGATAHRGIQRAARTLIVNPGCLADSSATWVDWRRHSGAHVEFLELAPSPAARPASCRRGELVTTWPPAFRFSPCPETSTVKKKGASLRFPTDDVACLLV
jgi:hypothetical protein